MTNECRSVREKGISQKRLLRRLLEAAARTLMPDEALIFDTRVSVAEVQEAGVRWYLIRGRENRTARRSQLLPGYQRGHQYGELVSFPWLPDTGIGLFRLPHRMRSGRLCARDGRFTPRGGKVETRHRSL